jgi:alpha-tubulin suppressor-like RCC1 family protein
MDYADENCGVAVFSHHIILMDMNRLLCLALVELIVCSANLAWAGGTVVAWGDDRNGRTNVPAGLTDVVAIAAGDEIGVALQNNGLVTVWGSAFIPTCTLSNAVAITAGELCCLAVEANGTVAASGYYWNNDWSWVPMTVPDGLTNVVSIAAGRYSVLALRADGTVVAWGNDYYGQIDIPAGLSNVVAIADGSSDSLALRADGTVVAWGQIALARPMFLPA